MTIQHPEGIPWNAVLEMIPSQARRVKTNLDRQIDWQDLTNSEARGGCPGRRELHPACDRGNRSNRHHRREEPRGGALDRSDAGFRTCRDQGV